MQQAASYSHTDAQKKYFMLVVKAYKQYADTAVQLLHGSEDEYPAWLKEIVSIQNRQKEIAVRRNQRVLNHALDRTQAWTEEDLVGIQVPLQTHDKIRSILKQSYRQWSAQAAPERQQSFGPIIKAVCELIPKKAKVLVPGCGLGRLPFQLCKMGYNAQGNQFSFQMLLMSDLLINNGKANHFKIHPFATLDSFETVADSLQSFMIPDQVVQQFEEGVEMSMAAGQFVGSFWSEQEGWQAVTTCFFIDTAHNVMDYLSCIHRCLVSGGVWINNGPLLYHYHLNLQQLSSQLSAIQLERAISKRFMIKEWRIEECEYCSSNKCLSRITYRSLFFIAIKA